MTIVTVQFDYKGQTMYERLTDVFKKSVDRVMPDVNFVEINLPCPGPKVKKVHSLLSNTLKLREWKKWMDTTDEETVFMDCDMLMLQSIESAFEQDFDVAYTVRTSAKMPMNGGVIFLKPSDGARRFMTAWLDVNERMYKDRVFHAPYRQKYAGMNQAAFGYLLENPLENVTMEQLPCSVWNSCSEDWRWIDSVTKNVHVKSYLRKLVLGIGVSRKPANAYSKIIEIWRRIESGGDPTPLIEGLSKFDKRNIETIEHQLDSQATFMAKYNQTPVIDDPNPNEEMLKNRAAKVRILKTRIRNYKRKEPDEGSKPSRSYGNKRKEASK